MSTPCKCSRVTFQQEVSKIVGRKSCTICRGLGSVDICPRCDGAGIRESVVCVQCNGHGKVGVKA
jgi:hypothetical protein